MRRILFLILMLTLPLISYSQSPMYEYLDLEKGDYIPENINSSRVAVIVNVLSIHSGFSVEGDWEKFSDQVHSSLYKMGIDAVIYINENDFISGNSTKNFYRAILTQRAIKNLIFVTQKEDGVELLCSPYNGSNTLINNAQSVYFRKSTSLNGLVLEFARDVKRAENPMQSFLIPDRPTYLNALSIVEKANLKNYPGQIRRSKMAVEKFPKLVLPEEASQELIAKIDAYNSNIELKNVALEKILEGFPWEIELIEYMSDEDLLRKRYQFVLRSLYASGKSIKAILKYKIMPGEAGYVSVIPVMPDNTSIKTYPQKTLLHKFYIRQNIAKNIYVGKWDADEDWKNAIQNYIGNMIQYFNKGN